MSPKPAGKESAPKVPADLRKALAAAPLAQATWMELTQISRRDYVSWINEAKQPATRARRIERCCENLEKGKRRPCCYAVVPMDFYKALGELPTAKAAWSALTADEKRDFKDWIESSEEKATRKVRIEKACTMIAAGKRGP